MATRASVASVFAAEQEENSTFSTQDLRVVADKIEDVTVHSVSSKMDTMSVAKQAAIPPVKAASGFVSSVEEARELIARVEAAEKAGVEMNEENMRNLGYMETPGKVWQLPIPVYILRQL
jgi:hypothetical protein